ncbi:MAG: hypothetical protein DRO89_05925 [Candidatus Altiarchaeales archaeon]|nr:MAG: hypothetical protein DRO89_05925 [Candidatus Altiarchaeales archaeon]
MISIQILVQNDETTIERLLDSLVSLDPQLLVGDLGCTDRTIEMCKERGAHIFKLDGSDMSKIRNRLIAAAHYDWVMWVEPWEVLVDVAPIKKAIASQPSLPYNLRIITSDMMTHEVRLWNKKDGYHFRNPVCEYLDVSGATMGRMNCSIYSDGKKQVPLDVLQKWHKAEPASPEPIYYEAFYYLSNQEWEKFISKATHYLFDRKRSTQSAIMLKYYLAIVLCHVKKNAKEAIKHTIECLAVRPLMAEFWCLLGDIFYHLAGDYAKSKQFYHNAAIMGSYRWGDDIWPMEIAKYEEYPRKMMTSCDALLEEPPTIVRITN